jgi:hypothetical protein
MSNNAELADATHALLRACGELYAAQTVLNCDREATPVPRDYALHKTVEAFERFATAARAIKQPIQVTIRLKPLDR